MIVFVAVDFGVGARDGALFRGLLVGCCRVFNVSRAFSRDGVWIACLRMCACVFFLLF